MRGRARTHGEPVSCDIQRKLGRWYAAITIACSPTRSRGTQACGLDWGVETFATVAHEDGSFTEIQNPRFTTLYKDKITSAQTRLARAMRDSKGYKRAKRTWAALNQKISNRRRDFLHKSSALLVSMSRLIATESFSISNLTSSGRGSAVSPGRGVSRKAALNREILSTAPSAFLAMIRYKAAEAGVEFVEASARKLRPTQRCSSCWTVRRKTLANRRHDCLCGTSLGRDQNSARVCLFWALSRTGREPAELTVS